MAATPAAAPATAPEPQAATASEPAPPVSRPTFPVSPTPSASWHALLRTWANEQLASGQDGILDAAAITFERTLLEAALDATHGQRIEAAKRLGWGRNTLTRKIKELGLGEE